jgi:mRNA interferase MazF
LKRGDVVIAVMAGDYGNPRPAVVVQGDALLEYGFSGVVICPMSSESGGSKVRIAVVPNPENGLQAPSEVMVEKLIGLPQHKLRRVIGHLDAATMRRIDRAVFVVLGLGRARS